MDEAEKRRREKIFNALAEYQSKGVIDIEPGRLERMLEWESDRGLVVLMGTFVEDALFDRICRELPNGQAQRRALAKGGPLRSFEQRITMARAFDFLEDEELEMIAALRAMRNACAHCRQDITFETPQLRDALKLMIGDVAAASIDAVESDLTPQTSFIHTTAYLLAVLTDQSEPRPSQFLTAMFRAGIRNRAQPKTSPKRRSDKRVPNPRPRPKDKGR